jgi:hypothetical protein
MDYKKLVEQMNEEGITLQQLNIACQEVMSLKGYRGAKLSLILSIRRISMGGVKLFLKDVYGMAYNSSSLENFYETFWKYLDEEKNNGY